MLDAIVIEAFWDWWPFGIATQGRHVEGFLAAKGEMRRDKDCIHLAPSIQSIPQAQQAPTCLKESNGFKRHDYKLCFQPSSPVCI